jgi:NADPH-dependent 2,4-dienoyl-CoA reductase/sulfur reductase-like enzyme
MTETVLIVGASIGGVRTAQALRVKGYGGRIVLLGAEADLPYDKPPLSKQFLATEWDENRIGLLTAEAASALEVELRLGVAATELEVDARVVTLQDGSSIPYSRVVLATGAAAKPAPWDVESGVHVLRTLADGRLLREALCGPGSVVVVGGGFVGAEVAAAARAVGQSVTVVDPLQAPMARVLGDAVGELFARIHTSHGVTSRFGVNVENVTGRAGAWQVKLSDGETLSATNVVVGIGATPNVEWLADSGLLLDDGVVCDEFCRALGQPEVYAVGDVARWMHLDHGEYIRLEHWTNAVDQAACVAHNITNPADQQPYRSTEYVWSDQYDWRIQIVGCPQRGDSYEVFGDPSSNPPRFAAIFRTSDNRLAGAVTVNWSKALVACRRIVGAQGAFDEASAALS